MADSIILDFGKYKNQRIEDVIEKDLDYCNWLINQKDFKTKNPKLFNFFINSGIKQDKEYIKRMEEEHIKKQEYFMFGKYKDSKISDIVQQDRKYCEYIVSLEYIKKVHKPTIEKINTLIATNDLVL